MAMQMNQVEPHAFGSLQNLQVKRAAKGAIFLGGQQIVAGMLQGKKDARGPGRFELFDKTQDRLGDGSQPL